MIKIIKFGRQLMRFSEDQRCILYVEKIQIGSASKIIILDGELDLWHVERSILY